MITSEVSKLENWVDAVIEKLPHFLGQMGDLHVEGRYKYSLSGDLSSDCMWGLANTVFATKIRYMLKQLDNAETNQMAKFIKSFQNANGEISDSFVHN